jgi:hypothetical protein
MSLNGKRVIAVTPTPTANGYWIAASGVVAPPPPPPPDLDCSDIAARNFPVVGADTHGFDGDKDRIGCETSVHIDTPRDNRQTTMRIEGPTEAGPSRHGRR